MADVTKLVEDVQKLTSELRSEFDAYKADVDALSEAKIERLNAEINRLEEKMERAETGNKQAERKAQFEMKIGVEEGEPFSYAKAFRGIVFGTWTDAEREKKALATTPDASGGVLVPTEQAREVIDLLRAATVFDRLNVSRYTPTYAPFDVPKLIGGATGYMVGENADITASQPNFEQIRLQPNKAAGLVPISNALLRKADPVVNQIVENDLTAVIARLLDLQYLQGDGIGTNMTGVLNTAGVNSISMGTNGAPVTVDTLHDAVYAIETSNAAPTAWVMHPRTKNSLRKLKGTNGHYLLQPVVTAGVPATLLGMPFFTTTQIPINLTAGTATNTSYILLGRWSEAIVAEWAGLQLEASREASYFDGTTLQSAFSRDQTVIRAIVEVDFALRHAGAFCKITGITPA